MSTARAMRYLSPEPVPDALLRTIIQAAMWAPSGHNAQDEHFVVVTDRATIARLAPLWRETVEDCRTADSAMEMERLDPVSLRTRDGIDFQRDHFEEIPALIVVCHDSRALVRKRRSLGPAWRILRKVGWRRTARMSGSAFRTRIEAASIYPAVENLLLAARAHGLGSCLTTWLLLREDEVKTILGIPREIGIFAVIPVGWPLRPFGPVNRRAVDAAIHRDRW
jgi:nitroreductase